MINFPIVKYKNNVGFTNFVLVQVDRYEILYDKKHRYR
jgi:hypothetical protein